MPGISIQGWHGRLHRGHLDLAGSAQQLQFGQSLLLETSQILKLGVGWVQRPMATQGSGVIYPPVTLTWFAGKCPIELHDHESFSKGCGRPESNTLKNRTPKLPGHFGLVLEANPARSLGNLYSECPHPIKIPSKSHQNPIKIPSKSHQNPIKSHHVSRLMWTLAFVHPPWALGPQVFPGDFRCRSEPFMRQLDGREVAVLLMDTQAQTVTRGGSTLVSLVAAIRMVLWGWE